MPQRLKGDGFVEIRAELAPKGEAVNIKPGSIVTLETQTLTVEARVIDLAYGSGALPPNSFLMLILSRQRPVRRE